MKKLYHFELGFPKGLKTKFGIIPITYTQHAQKAAEDDRYGKMVLPSTINTTTARCIEAEVNGNVVSKLVYRAKYNHELDMILVLSRDCSVRTVWFNKRGDKHKTLDASKYTVPTKAVKK